jgi:hypothetical protein
VRACPICHEPYLGSCCGCRQPVTTPALNPERVALARERSAAGRRSRAKGRRGEAEFAELLSSLLGGADVDVEVTSSLQRSYGPTAPDITVLGEPLWIECKRGKRVDWRAALRQAEEAAAANGNQWRVMVLARDDHAAPVVVMPLAAWAELARAWLRSRP